MTAVEPIQSGPYPIPTDPPDGPSQMSEIVTWVAGRLVMRFASTAARDAAITSPVEGMIAVTGTGDTLQTWQYRSAGWRNITVRPWAAYTAALTAAATNPTNATVSTRWCQNGGLARVHFQISASGSFTPGSGVWALSLPVAASTALSATAGVVRLFDASSNQATLGRVAIASSTTIGFQAIRPQAALSAYGTLDNVAHNVPWTWAPGDIADGFLDFEVA